MHGVTQSVTHGVIQSVTHGVTQSVTHGVTHSVTQNVTHGVTQSVTHDVTHSVTQNVTHGVTQSVTHGVTQPNPRIRVFERYQQRFLTIGLPALLKIPPKYNIQVSLHFRPLDQETISRILKLPFQLESWPWGFVINSFVKYLSSVC